MIKSFSDKKSEKIFNRDFSKKIPEDIQNTAYRKLVMVNSAVSIQDLKSPPGNRLEKLKGKRKDQYSIRINNQWRICFYWGNGDAYEVEIEDCH